MEKEISSGTMLGIVLIALAAVIGLGFGVFSIAKGVANEGTVGVQDNLNAVSDSAFEDYNDKIVTGTMVKSAVQNFAGKSVAILINTNAMDKGVKVYGNHNPGLHTWDLSTGGKFTTGTGEGASGGYSYVDNDEPTDPANLGVVTDDAIGVGHFVNYNAVLDGESTITKFELKDGVYTTDCAFLLDENTGKIVFDNTVGGFTRTGNCEYLSPSAKFTANLIKDTSGTAIGIVFEQQIK